MSDAGAFILGEAGAIPPPEGVSDGSIDGEEVGDADSGGADDASGADASDAGDSDNESGDGTGGHA